MFHVGLIPRQILVQNSLPKGGGESGTVADIATCCLQNLLSMEKWSDSDSMSHLSPPSAHKGFLYTIVPASPLPLFGVESSVRRLYAMLIALFCSNACLQFSEGVANRELTVLFPLAQLDKGCGTPTPLHRAAAAPFDQEVWTGVCGHCTLVQWSLQETWA